MAADYQDRHQELVEREEYFFLSDYEGNGTDLSGAGHPYLHDIDDQIDQILETLMQSLFEIGV